MVLKWNQLHFELENANFLYFIFLLSILTGKKALEINSILRIFMNSMSLVAKPTLTSGVSVVSIPRNLIGWIDQVSAYSRPSQLPKFETHFEFEFQMELIKKR